MDSKLNINWEKTKKRVLGLITKYLFYILSIDNCPNFNETSDFILPELNENNISKYVKITNNEKKDRLEFINYFDFSFNKLTTEERKLIYWSYIDKENNYDDRFIANTLGFSLGYFYIKKKETIIRFAFSLGVEEFN